MLQENICCPLSSKSLHFCGLSWITCSLFSSSRGLPMLIPKDTSLLFIPITWLYHASLFHHRSIHCYPVIAWHPSLPFTSDSPSLVISVTFDWVCAAIATHNTPSQSWETPLASISQISSSSSDTNLLLLDLLHTGPYPSSSSCTNSPASKKILLYCKIHYQIQGRLELLHFFYW